MVMGGWKTWLGVAMTAASAVLTTLGYTEVARAVESLGVAIIGIGIGSKIEKFNA